MRANGIGVGTICFGLVVIIAASAGTAYDCADDEWCSYGERYAIIVMGGNVTGQMYLWYWGDTSGMYRELISHGFTAENIYFLSYGDSADAHPDWVDGLSTTNNIRTAYQWAESRCRAEDLLYIYWVDHGSPNYFVTHNGTITHAELGTLMQPIVARQIIGAYNPCYSGAVIDDISRVGVITVTSQDAFHGNSWGWAGQWRRALRGAPADSVDTNGDRYISMTEAYNWICPRSQAAGEHSMFDDNGDGIGHECTDLGYDPDDPLKDGFVGKFYSLDGWWCGGGTPVAGETEAVPWAAESDLLELNYPNPFNPRTTIAYTIRRAERVSLSIYDSTGRMVRTLVESSQQPGRHTVVWDGRDNAGRRVDSGVYFCRIATGSVTETGKMVLVK
ncbi:MAG: T9SS type A sorting domain-containing protein [Candidatus Eisenbacteria sp.]|nr:T9SS type A sorting domain-containing protein [Candidatus Eisenbacteria bacterium]